MTVTLLAGLAGLALIDSTSIGTLLLPVWFLLMPTGVRTRRYLLYLGTIAAFYLTVGVALLLGGRAWLGDLQEWVQTPAGARIGLLVGVGLLVGSFFIGRRTSTGPGRLARWRERAMGPQASGGVGLMALALAAGTLELAGMLPYLAGIGLLSATDSPVGLQIWVLAGYCLVMIAPALVLLVLRRVVAGLVEPILHRINAWMQSSGSETTAWVVGIVGFLIARSMWERADLVGLGLPLTG
ncbi:GAP family protein [Dermacoccaceae bacterium W4C1]